MLARVETKSFCVNTFFLFYFFGDFKRFCAMCRGRKLESREIRATRFFEDLAG